MRRLFLVLDLSLLRQQGEEQRQAVLEQLTVAFGRLWATYRLGGAGSGAPGRHISWGYALYDSACPELLLKPKLRETAKALKLPPAFQETLQTDCRGAALKEFLNFIDALTQPAEAAAADGPAPPASEEAPAAALARALQSALGSSYLKKLQEMADSDSSIAGSISRPEGLLAIFSAGLSAAPQLLHFLGPTAEAELAAVAAAGSPEEQQAGLQRLLAAALPAAVWQRCGAGSLRVCWVAADPDAAGPADEQPLAVLPALQAAMQQHCQCAAAAPLAELAGECSPAAFAARLALPQRGQGEVQQAAAGEAAGGTEGSWPAAAEGSREQAQAHLALLMTGANKELEAAKERARAEHKQLAKQRQHQARLPTGAGGRRAALVANNKGQRLLANAQRLQADKSRRGPSSRPASRQGTPEAAAMSDDQANLLAAATNRLGGEEEEVSSGTSLAPEAAAADLKRRVSDLLESTLADERPSLASMLAQVRTLVDGCFASMLRFSSQHQRAQQAQRAQQQASGAGEAPEVTSTPAGAAGAAGEGQPLGLDPMRALLLQHVPVAVADLRRQHMEAEHVAERRQLSLRFVLELLLRLSICAYGARPGGGLPVGQYEEMEVLMQCVVATLQPIPDAGHEVFLHIIKPAFGARFRAELQQLQGELWDDDMSLDLDSMHDQHLKDIEKQEESGETPGCSAGAIHSGSMLTGNGTSGRTGPAAVPAVPAAPAGPSNLGRVASAAQREASGREGTNSGRPSAGTGLPSSSAMSGEHSGVQGGSGATTAAGLARSGAAAARTATSSGALMNLAHIKQRYNNTKQFELQVRSKPTLLQKGKLKHTVASSRPPAATTAPPRRAGAGGAATAGGTAGGGSSRAAAALAAATSKGRGTAAAAAAARQPRPKQQVPDTPDSRGKALRSAAETEARLARARGQQQQAQQQQQPEQQPEESMLSGGAIISPDKNQQLLRGPGAPAASGLDAIPATDTRPALAAVPAGVAQAAAAAAAGGGRLMRSPSMRLDFGSLPGAILPSQRREQDLSGLDGGSTSTSPIGGPLGGPATAAAAAAEGPTWMVAATRPTRRQPAVASFGALVASGSQPQRAQPAQAAQQAQPVEEPVSDEQQAGMEWEAGALPASPSQGQLPAEADAAMAVAEPEAEAEGAAAQPEAADMAAVEVEADAADEAAAAAEPAAEAEAPADTEAAPASTRRTRSASRGRTAVSEGGEALPSAATRRGRSASRAADAATPAQQAQQAEQQEEEGEEETAPAGRRTTRGAAAAAAAEAARLNAPRRSGRHTPGGQDAATPIQPTSKPSAGSKGKGKKRAAPEPPAAAEEEAAAEPAAPAEEAAAAQQAEPATEAAPRSAPRRGRNAGPLPAEEAAADQPTAAAPAAAPGAAAAARRTRSASRGREALAAAAADAAEEAEAQAAASIKKRQRRKSQGEVEAADAAKAAADATEAEAAAEMAAPPALPQQQQEQAEDAQPETAPASAKRTRSASRGGVAAAADGAAAPGPATRRGRSSSRAADAATTPAQHAQQAEEEADEDAAEAAATAEAAQQAAPRRSGRHTPGGQEAAAPAEPSGKQSAGKPSAGSKGKGKKRAAPEPAAADAEAGEAMEAESAGEQQAVPAEQSPAEQLAEPAAQPAAGLSGLAGLTKLLGCRRCPGSKTGCLSCRPKLAAALAEAGAEQLLAGVGECGKGNCRSGTGCTACWAVVKQRLHDPTAAAPAPAVEATTAVEAAPAVATVATEAQPAAAPAEPAAKPAAADATSRLEEEAPAPKRRRTRHSAAAEEQGAATTPAPSADEASAAQAADGSRRSSKRGKPADSAAVAASEAADPAAVAPLSGPRRGRSAGLAQEEAAAGPGPEPQSTGRRSRSAGPSQPSPAPSAPASRPASRRRSLVAEAVAAERAAQEEAEQAARAAAEAAAAAAGEAASDEPMQEASPADEAAQPAAGEPAAMDVDAAAAAAAGPAGTPPAAVAAAAPADPASAAIDAAMDAAGALSQQLDVEGILAATIVPSPADMAALPPAPSLGTPGPATAAAVAKAAADAAAAAAAADQAAAAEAEQQQQQGEAEAAGQRRRRVSGGSISKEKRLGLLQSSAGKPKKRSAADVATSSQPHKRSLPSTDAASRSPVAALLRQAAGGGASAAAPSSPYEGAYDFPAPSAGAGAAAAAAAQAEPAAEGAEGELVADSAAARSPAGRGAAAAALGAADASSPARTAAAASPAGSPAVSGQPAAPEAAVAEQQQQEQQEQAAPGPDFAGARVFEHLRRQEQQRLAAQQVAQHVQQAQQGDEQPDEQQHSGDSCVESAVPDSQLQQLSPPEVGQQRPAGSPAATPVSRQRRLSPGGPPPGAGAGPKPAATAQSQQQPRQQQQQQQAVGAAVPAAPGAAPPAVPKPETGDAVWYFDTAHDMHGFPIFLIIASVVSEKSHRGGGFTLEVMCQPEGADNDYPFTLRSKAYCHPPILPARAGQWRLAVPHEVAVVRRFPDRKLAYLSIRPWVDFYSGTFVGFVGLELRQPWQQTRPKYWEYLMYLRHRGFPVPFAKLAAFTRPEITLAKLQAVEQILEPLAAARPAAPEGGQQAAAAAAAAPQQRAQAVPVQRAAAQQAQQQQQAHQAAAAPAAAAGGVAVPVQAAPAAAPQRGGGVAVAVQPVQAAVPQQGGGVAVPVQAAAAAAPQQGGMAVPVQAAAAVPGEPDGHAVEVQPSASQPSQVTAWLPPDAPGETVRHNAATRQHQRRRDSLDSLLLPESREWQASQQAAGLAEPPPSEPRRGLNFGGSPAAARAPAPGSAVQARPPLPRGHPAAPSGTGGLFSPNRLGSCSDFSARKNLRPSPSPLRPAAGNRLHAASPQVLPPASAAQPRYAQSPGAAAAGLAAASPAHQQQQQQRVVQQLWAQSPVAAGGPATAAATPRAQQTPPAQQAQQASSNWERYSERLAPLLEQLPVHPHVPASPSAAGGRASSFRMAQQGDVLLHCRKTNGFGGLPELQRVLVLNVRSVNEGSPKQSHQAEVVQLATGADPSSLDAQPGKWGSIVLGKAGYMEKDEGVRRLHNWRIQGSVPPQAMAELEQALQQEAATAAGELV